MNKKEVNIEETPKAKVEERKYSLPKPKLLKRIGAAFIDFFLVLLLFIGVEAGMYYTVFNPLGYHSSIQNVHTLYDDSHLYVYSSSLGYLSLTEAYDDKKTPDENYDPYLVYYFSNDSRAIKENKLTTYKEEKLAAKTLFMLDDNNEIVRISGSDDSKAREFYKNSYDKAITFFESDPYYYQNAHRPFLIIIFTSLVSVVLSGSVFYLLIPLLRKDGETIGQIIYKIGLCNAKDDTKVKKSQIVWRFVILIALNYLVPILLYASFDYLTFVPVLITLAMISFTKSNIGPHEYFTKTYLVNKKEVEIPLVAHREPIKDEDDIKNPYL